MSFNGEKIDSFKYLGALIGKKGEVVENMVEGANERAKVSATMKRLRKVRPLGLEAKRTVYERIVVPTMLYGAETWGLNDREKIN